MDISSPALVTPPPIARPAIQQQATRVEAPQPLAPSTPPPEVNALGIPVNLPKLNPQVADPSDSGAKNQAPRGAAGAEARADSSTSLPTATERERSERGVAQHDPAASSPTEVDPLQELSKGLSNLFAKDPSDASAASTNGKSAAPTRPGERVFDGLAAEEVPLFKQMSNDAYAKLYPAYLENKKLKGDLTAKEAEYATKLKEAESKRFYDHENAYLLDPEIQQYSQQVKEFSDLEEHFTEQLVAIKSNKPWFDVTRDANGQLVTTASQQASPQAEIAIQQHLYKLAAQKQFVGAEAQKRVATFKDEFTQVNTKIKEFESNILGPFEKVIAPHRDKVLNLFPASVRGKPEYKAIAGLIVALNQVVNSNQQLSARKTADPNAGALATGSPIEGQVLTSGGSVNPPKDVNALIDRMNRISRGEQA